jgi:hypothetical protein
MGLDAILRNPTNPDKYVKIYGSDSAMRVVARMNHYYLYATSGKTLKEVKLDMLRHIGEMMQQLDTYEYEPTNSRHDMRGAKSITLVSDLELIAQLIGELNKVDIPDDWIVEWDY